MLDLCLVREGGSEMSEMQGQRGCPRIYLGVVRLELKEVDGK